MPVVPGLAGAPVDVIEIDAASNTQHRGDPHPPRERQVRARARPLQGLHHRRGPQLTGAAFNALLKTLEEPPAHVVFVLATTDPKTSRPPCSRAAALRLPADRARAADREPHRASSRRRACRSSRPRCRALIRAAEGCLRDALSLLDTAIAYGEGRLDEAGVARCSARPRRCDVRGLRGGAARRRRRRRAGGGGPRRDRGRGPRRVLPRGDRAAAPPARAEGGAGREARADLHARRGGRAAGGRGAGIRSTSSCTCCARSSTPTRRCAARRTRGSSSRSRPCAPRAARGRRPSRR